MGDAAATAHFSIGSGTRLALDSAIALASYLHTEPTLEAAFAQVPGRAPPRRAAPAVGGAQLDGVVRGDRALLPPRPGAVHLLAAHPLAAHQPREPAAARRGLAERRRGWFQSRAGVGANAPVRRPMFAPFRAARAGAEEPHRRLADGAVQGRGRLPDRLAPRPPRRARQGRRRARLHRDDLRDARGPHLAPAAPAPTAPEHEAAWKRIVDFVHAETDAKICLQLGHSGAKGSTELGWVEDNRPLAIGQLADHLGLRRALVAAEPDAEGDGPRRHGPRSATPSSPAPRWPSAPASTCSSCTWRTATCSRPSSRR